MKKIIFSFILTASHNLFAGNDGGGIGSPVVSAMNAQALQKIIAVKYISEDEKHVYFEANTAEVMKVSHIVLDSTPSLDDKLSKSYLSQNWESL